MTQTCAIRTSQIGHLGPLGSLYGSPAGISRTRFQAVFSWLLLAAVLLLFLAPVLAHAQSAPTTVAAPTSPFSVQPDDYFVNYLMKGLLGPDINMNAAGAQTMVTGKGTMGDVFRAFNLGVAFFGSIIIMFVAVVGVLNTGQDGEFLGKRWSSFWVPLRFAGGAALMLPISTSGYSFVQAMCLWIAGQGVGFADSVWVAIVDNHAPKAGSTIVAPISTTSIVANMLSSEICLAYVNDRTAGQPLTTNVKFEWFVDQNSSTGVTSYKGEWWKQNPLVALAQTIDPLLATTGDNSYTYSSGILNGREICGALTFSFKNNGQDPNNDYRKLIGQTHMQEAGRIRLPLSILAKDYIDAAYGNAGAKTMQQVEVDMRKAIDRYSGEYTKALIAAADSQIKGSPLGTMAKMKDQMKSMGFAVGGAFYMQLVKTANAVRSGLQATPVYKPVDLEIIGKEYGSDNWLVIKKGMESVITEAAIDVSEKNMDGSVASGGTQGTSGSAPLTTVKTIDMNEKMFEGMTSGGFDKISHTVAMALLQSVIQVGSSNQTQPGPLSYGMNSQNFNNGSVGNPFSSTWNNNNNDNTSVILQLKNKGDTILNMAGLIYSSYIVTTAVVKGGSASIIGTAANLTTGGPAFLSSLLENVQMMLFSMVIGMVTLGVMLAIVIPFTPFMIWAMGIAGLLVLIIESLVASVIWAVMIMHPSGEGVTSDHSRQGLMILLMLFMRPALMLIGMEAGIFLVDPMVAFVNDMFSFVFSSTQEETVTGLFIVFGVCSIYVSLILAIIRKSFALIHIVPDRVLMWIGGGSSQLGESEIADRGESLAGTAGQRVSNLSNSAKPSARQQRGFENAKDRARANKGGGGRVAA